MKNSLGYIRFLNKTSKIVNNLKGQKRESWETTQTVNLNGKYSKRWILWHITTLLAAALSSRAVRDWLMLHREKGHMAAGYCWQKGSKLDGFDDRPSTDYLQQVKKNYGTWHLTADTWHMTHDMTCDALLGVNILSKSQLPSSYGLRLTVSEWKYHQLNE